MATWPWPLDGVQKWFEDLWNWVSTAAVNAVKVVNDWIKTAMSGLSKVVTDWFNQIWVWVHDAIVWVWDNVSSAITGVTSWISSAVSGLWSNISDWFNQIWVWVHDAIVWVWNNVSSAITGVTDWISTAVSGLWSNISDWFNQIWVWVHDSLVWVWDNVSSAVSGIGSAISSGLGGLWSSVSGFLTTFWNDVSGSIGAIGGAISSGFSGFTGLISGLLTGFATAMGTALQTAVTAVTSTLTSVAGTVIQIVNQDVITPLMNTLNWILSSVSSVISGLWNSIVATLRGAGVGTPETAVILSIPLLLTSVSAVFVMGVLGSVGDIKIMGCGIQLSSLTNQLIAAFGIVHFASAVFSPILDAAYSQPVKYYWDSVFRPAIVATGTADEMFFHNKITETYWRQVYAYHGWKEIDITNRYDSMWTKPTQRIVLSLLSDPDVPESWIRSCLAEQGVHGDDLDVLVDYGTRQYLKDERTALATVVETDYRNNVIQQAECEADLAALKFMPQEIIFKIQKVQFLIARDTRAAALKASAIPVSKLKSLTEAEIDMEFKLGLSTPEKYVQNLMDFGFSQSAAQRKYAIAVTPKPLTSTEKTRLIDDLNAKVAKARQRYAILLAREDLNTSFYADMIDYLSSLEKPPEARIVTLQEQIIKTAGEKQLIMQQEQNELADLQGQLKVLGVAG